MSPRHKPVWYLLLLIAAVASVVGFMYHKHSTGPQAILREIEKKIGVPFPRRYDGLEVELATEFCYVGKMRVSRADADSFLRQMNFDPKPGFNYVYLSTWGKYRELFQDSQKVTGFLHAHGVVEGKNSWEFAYNPATDELWFCLGYTLPEPRVLEKGYSR